MIHHLWECAFPTRGGVCDCGADPESLAELERLESRHFQPAQQEQWPDVPSVTCSRSAREWRQCAAGGTCMCELIG